MKKQQTKKQEVKTLKPDSKKAQKKTTEKAQSSARKAAIERKKRKQDRDKLRVEHKLGFRFLKEPVQRHTKPKRTWSPPKDEANKRILERTQQCQLSVYTGKKK